MSLKIDDIRRRVGEFYPDIKTVSENVLRFYKRAPDDSPFAVCYLDLAQSLPATESDLRRYVERVIGAQYFEGKSSLQWNNYLYFVRDALELRQPAAAAAKELIERDREYARKFVIGEDGLEKVLRPAVVNPTADEAQVDVASRWADILKQPYLIEAVFGVHTLADRKRLIDGDMLPPKPCEENRLNRSRLQGLLPHLQSLEIENYRPCLNGKKFDFGNVNLLFGVNGSGKTSLLEAIELIYCGRNRRNPDVGDSYSFRVAKENGASEIIDDQRREQEFRESARIWFGMNEPTNRASKLYDGFGRFSFLNTDAAVDLAKDTENNIDEDLARLLVGSEAAINWQTIRRLRSEVDSALGREIQREIEIDSGLKLARQSLADSATIKTESDSLRTALLDGLRRNHWSVDESDLENAAGLLVEQLSELRGVAQQVRQLEWLDSPVSLGICQQFVSTAQGVIAAEKSRVQQLQSLEARQSRLVADRGRSQEAFVLVTELYRLVEAGVECRIAELAEQRMAVTRTTDLLAGIDEQTLEVSKTMPGDRPISMLHESAVQARKLLEESLSAARKESETFAKMRERTTALAQQLRSLAAEIIGDGPSTECPLCHTKFLPGELARHMALGLDEHLEAAAQKLLNDVAQLEKDLREAEGKENAVDRIMRFCVSIQLTQDVKLEDALSNLAETQAKWRDARVRIDALTSEVHSLRASGLSPERMNEVRSKLTSLGYTGSMQLLEDVTVLRSTIEEHIRTVSAAMKSDVETIKEIRATVQAALEPFRPSVAHPKEALVELEEREATTKAIYSRLMQFHSCFAWSNSRPIAEWIVEAEAVASVASKLQTALGSERVITARSVELTKRKSQLEADQKQTFVRRSRLKEAKAALDEICGKHSLGIVTQSALEKNRSAIETIFAQIHSPAEFKGIEFNESKWWVARKSAAEKVRLTQISTGQRAAFALSVFMAQNAQLRAGPPVILIDDPIAHVDDLNCLSFLDYLREVSLAGTRQIFFATASDKLASLFQRKFDFLGERFKRLDPATGTLP